MKYHLKIRMRIIIFTLFLISILNINHELIAEEEIKIIADQIKTDDNAKTVTAEGDVVIFKIRSHIPNHCGVYLEDDIFMHHAENRLSCRESLYPFWIRNISRYARYAKS